MSWKRIVGDNKKGPGKGRPEDRYKGIGPIPPQQVVPTRGKSPKKKERREVKERLRSEQYDE